MLFHNLVIIYMHSKRSAGPLFEQIRILFTQWCFVPRFVEIALSWYKRGKVMLSHVNLFVCLFWNFAYSNFMDRNPACMCILGGSKIFLNVKHNVFYKIFSFSTVSSHIFLFTVIDCLNKLIKAHTCIRYINLNIKDVIQLTTPTPATPPPPPVDLFLEDKGRYNLFLFFL